MRLGLLPARDTCRRPTQTTALIVVLMQSLAFVLRVALTLMLIFVDVGSTIRRLVLLSSRLTLVAHMPRSRFHLDDGTRRAAESTSQSAWPGWLVVLKLKLLVLMLMVL